MEDQSAFTLLGDPDFWNTPYPIAPARHDACVRETDDPPPATPLTARQQLARALRWSRLMNGWSQEALGLAAGLDRTYVGLHEGHKPSSTWR